MATYTAEEVKAQSTVTWWPLRNCGLCGATIGYIIGEQIMFDSSCDCSSYGTPPRPSSWEEVANLINIQPTEDTQLKMLAELRGEQRDRDLG